MGETTELESASVGKTRPALVRAQVWTHVRTPDCCVVHVQCETSHSNVLLIPLFMPDTKSETVIFCSAMGKTKADPKNPHESL